MVSIFSVVKQRTVEVAKMDQGEVSCLHCHSTNVKFKYLNNRKADQHRYHCLECKEWFTLEDHKRPKPKHYMKKRNQDPVEIQGQRTQCSKCFAVNNARFKFYNNKEKYGETQPRVKCLSCNNFQMHLEGGVLVAIKTSSKKSPILNANEDDLDMFDILFPAEGGNPPDPSYSLQLQDPAEAAYEYNLDDSPMHDEDHHEGPHHASSENPCYDWENGFGELIDNPNRAHANDYSSDSFPSVLSTDGFGMMNGVPDHNSEALAAADMIYLSDFEELL